VKTTGKRGLKTKEEERGEKNKEMPNENRSNQN